MGNIFNCGVYRWVNTLNGKSYIGSSLGLSRRKQRHLRELKCNKHPNRHLQAAWTIYGETAFQFEVLSYCLETDLLWQEQLAINAFRAVQDGYNLAKFPTSPMKGLKHTLATRELMSKGMKSAWTPERRAIQSQYMTERNKARLGEVRGSYSMERRTAISQSKKTGNCCEPFRDIITGLIKQGVSSSKIWKNLVAAHGFGYSEKAVQNFTISIRSELTNMKKVAA